MNMGHLAACLAQPHNAQSEAFLHLTWHWFYLYDGDLYDEDGSEGDEEDNEGG